MPSPRDIATGRFEIESLETRQLLSVATLVANNTLTINWDTPTEIQVQESSQRAGHLEILANGTLITSQQGIPAAELSEISLIGSNGDDLVDLSLLDSSVFPTLRRISATLNNGNDILFGSDIPLFASLGDGDDAVIAGTASDVILCGDGRDIVFGLGGNDTINGGDGDDYIIAGDGDDLVSLGNGNDIASSGTGADTLGGDQGSDTLDGGADNDSIDGHSGDDIIFGSDGNDIIQGGGGDDALVGELGDDTLRGQSGSDYIDGGNSDNSFDGGSDVIDGGLGDDILLGSAGTDLLIGGQGHDIASGDDDDDTVLGGAGKDSLFGGPGNDILRGQGGGDSIAGLGGSDQIDGGDGNDYLISSFDFVNTESQYAYDDPSSNQQASSSNGPQQPALYAQTQMNAGSVSSGPQAKPSDIHDLLTFVNTHAASGGGRGGISPSELSQIKLETSQAVPVTISAYRGADAGVNTNESSSGAHYFEQNVGQVGSNTAFFYRNESYTLTAGVNGVQFEFSTPLLSNRTHSVTMNLLGPTASTKVVGYSELPGKSNYLIGSNSSEWITNVPHYEGAKIPNAYNGIDLIYYANETRELEYDFLVHPGANPADIQFRFDGSTEISLQQDGDLVVRHSTGELHQKAPVAFQETPIGRMTVPVQFNLSASGVVSFELGEFDPRYTLVIDPVVDYFSYIGSLQDDTLTDIAVDNNGFIYVTTDTTASNFPLGAMSLPLGLPVSGYPNAQGQLVTVTKLDPTQSGNSSLVYATYFGGTRDTMGVPTTEQRANAIRVRPNGNAVVVGETVAIDFPITANAVQPTGPIQGGISDLFGFVSELNATGDRLIYSTYLGGVSAGSTKTQTNARDVDVDSSGRIAVTGSTSSNSYITTSNAYQSADPHRAGRDAFVTVIDPNANSGAGLLYSSYFGGSQGNISQLPGDDDAGSISLNSDGTLTIAGKTRSSDLPTTLGAYQPTYGGSTDAFFSRFDPGASGGASLVYSTYFGTDSAETFGGMDVDSFGSVYLVGSVVPGSSAYPVTPGAFQTQGGGGPDVFVGKWSPDGLGASDLEFLTLYGNEFTQYGLDIAVDDFGNSYLAGAVISGSIPLVDEVDSTKRSSEHFAAVLNPDGTDLVFSTYYGGDFNEKSDAAAVAVGPQGQLYLAGSTQSPSGIIPGTESFQPNLQGSGTVDAYVAVISGISVPTPRSFSISDITVTEGDSGTTNAVFTVSLSAALAPATQATVSFSTQAVSAQVGVDFQSVSGQLTFLPGSGLTQSIVVPIVGDTTPESLETFLVTLTNPQGGVTISPSGGSAVGTIVDNDGNGGPSLVPSSVTVLEGSGRVTLSIQLPAPSPSNQTFLINLASNTAFVPSDAQLDPILNGQVTVPAGSTAQSFDILISNDTEIESTESFSVSFSYPIGTVGILGANTSIVTILDDDSPPPSADLLGDTIIGGQGDDVIVGGYSGDILNGGNGNDLILGQGGDDSILGGSGRDLLLGDDGDDLIRGNGQSDTVDGGAGNDTLVWRGAQDGDDSIYGILGYDSVSIVGGNGDDAFTIQQDAQFVAGRFIKKAELLVLNGAANARLNNLEHPQSSLRDIYVNGNGGADRIVITDIDLVGRRNLIVQGGPGRDRLDAVDSKIGMVQLQLSGGDDADFLRGSTGGDRLLGDDGNDTLLGGSGDDLIDLGFGDDSAGGNDGDDQILGLAGNDTIAGGNGNDSITGDLGHDSLTGDSGDDSIDGGLDNDSLFGLDGVDSLLGGLGLDLLNGGDGNDYLDGGRNDDSLFGNRGNDFLVGGHGNDVIAGGSGDDTLVGSDGNDSIYGHDGSDAIDAGDGDDLALGGDGSDTILGGDGNDSIAGGMGRDTCLGGDGNDLINGQGASDVVGGNLGVDIVRGTASEIDESFILSPSIIDRLFKYRIIGL